MRSFQNFQRRVGFTNTETNVVLFVILAFILGVGVNLFNDSSSQVDYLEFDYKVQDSLFDAASGDPLIITDSAAFGQKKIDYKPELLDFSKGKKAETKAGKVVPGNRRININTASAEELASLPGLGSKIARSIIEYREQHGPFKEVDDLLKVKRIKNKKLERIKEFVIAK